MEVGLWEVSRDEEGAFMVEISEFTRTDLGEVLSFSTARSHPSHPTLKRHLSFGILMLSFLISRVTRFNNTLLQQSRLIEQ